jgi:hypothetical protein
MGAKEHMGVFFILKFSIKKPMNSYNVGSYLIHLKISRRPNKHKIMNNLATKRGKRV